MAKRSRRAKLWQFPSNFYQKWKRFPRYIDLNKVLAEGCHGAKLWPLPLCFQPILKLRWFHSSSLFFGIRGSNGMGQNRELSNPIILDLWEPMVSVSHSVRFSIPSLPLQPFNYVWHPYTNLKNPVTHIDIIQQTLVQKMSKRKRNWSWAGPGSAQLKLAIH